MKSALKDKQAEIKAKIAKRRSDLLRDIFQEAEHQAKLRDLPREDGQRFPMSKMLAFVLQKQREYSDFIRDNGSVELDELAGTTGMTTLREFKGR